MADRALLANERDIASNFRIVEALSLETTYCPLKPQYLLFFTKIICSCIFLYYTMAGKYPRPEPYTDVQREALAELGRHLESVERNPKHCSIFRGAKQLPAEFDFRSAPPGLEVITYPGRLVVQFYQSKTTWSCSIHSCKELCSGFQEVLVRASSRAFV